MASTSIRKQGRGPMTTVAPPAKARRARLSFAALNLRIGLLRFIALINGALLLSLVWMLIAPHSSLGILAPLGADIEAAQPLLSALAIRRTIVLGIGFVFFADVSQSLRRLPPSYASLSSLSGQAILFVITLVYVLMGRLSLLALYGTGGTLILSAAGIVIVVQSYQDAQRYRVRKLLYPLLSGAMGFLGIALILSPDTATRQLIELRYGGIVFVALLTLLAWGCGQLRQNHLTPDKMVRRVSGLILFPLFSLRLWATGQSISLLGVLNTLSVAGLAAFLAFVQAQIERAERTQETQAIERQGPD